MSQEENLSQQPTGEGKPEQNGNGRRFNLTTPEWVTALATVAAAVAAIAACFIAYDTYQVAEDTSDLKSAVSNISALATQTKRQADNSDTAVKALTAQFGEMQKQTAAFRASAGAAQGQLREMRDEQRPIVDVATIESVSPLQTDPVIGAYIKFNVVNSGKSVAILAYQHAKLILNTVDSDVQKRAKEACRTPVKGANGHTEIGFNIRAGASIPMSAGYVLTPEETKTWKAKPELRMLIVGCIGYMFDSRHHHTPFIQEVGLTVLASRVPVARLGFCAANASNFHAAPLAARR